MRCTLWRDDVQLSTPVRAAHERHDRRTRLYLLLEHEGVAGYGEVGVQPLALNGDPGVEDVIAELLGSTLAQVLAVVDREGGLPSWTRMARFVGVGSPSSFAVALVEMAMLDRELRANDESVSSLWPRNFHTPLQATVSLVEPDAPWLIESDVARVRAKTRPGPLSGLALERVGELTVPVLLDFNCSATADQQVLEQVEAISRVADIAGVEQPYAAGNVIDHATLAAQLDVPVSLDEGVRNLRDLEQIARYAAAQMLCLKPARVGGVANARAMAQRAASLGLRPYLGGFFESGYARRVHRLLAESCVDEPSDVGPVAVSERDEGSEAEDVEGGFAVAPSARVLEGATVISTWP